MLAVVLISMSAVFAVQAQTTPWPEDDFDVEWEWKKESLESDLKSAAKFYEGREFRPPNLKIIELPSTHPEAGKTVHPIHVDVCPDDPDNCGEASYDAGRACFLRNRPPSARNSVLSRQRPTIQSAVHKLQLTIPLVQTIALPHELFHAVQNSYPSFLEFCSNGGTTTDKWFREGMADAMALEWLKRNRTREQINAYKKSRVRGWRNYHAPLIVGEGWETHGYHAQVRKPLQGYKTSSFWRYLGSKLIRAVLEFDGVTSNMETLDWLDQALQEAWVPICMKAFSDRVPTQPEPTSCKEASKYAGLYLVYPMFITRFAEVERNKGGLDVIFAENTTNAGGAIEERGSGRRQDGCILAEPSNIINPTIDVTLPPVAAECLRVPSKYAGKLFVHVKILGTPEYENLILGWNGCVQSLGSVLSDGGTKTKVWPVNRDVKAGINGCVKPKDGEDLLLVLSNIAPKAIDTELMQLEIMILQDEG